MPLSHPREIPLEDVELDPDAAKIGDGEQRVRRCRHLADTRLARDNDAAEWCDEGESSAFTVIVRGAEYLKLYLRTAERRLRSAQLRLRDE